MYPWFWFWAPRFQYPLSGSVAQDYKPSTDWLFGSIKREAGNGKIEQKTFSDVASYGKQLGLITEVIMDFAEQAAPAMLENSSSLKRLKEIQTKIEEIKTNEYEVEIDQIETMIKAILAREGQKSGDILSRLRRLLAEDGA